MKLTCDLCGSVLQMNADSQGATCAGCGINYSLDSLRQKLNAQPQTLTQTNTAFSPCDQTEPANSQPITRELILSRRFDLQAIRYVVTIVVDGEEVAVLGPKGGEISLPISQGDHQVYAIVKLENKKVDAVLNTFNIHVGDHNWCGQFYLRRTAWNAYWQFDMGEDVNDATRT